MAYQVTMYGKHALNNKNNNVVPYKAKLWQGKTLVNRLFQSFVKENVGKFTYS